MARKFGRGSEKGEMDFELNLASIIDCFTVLITYLLVSASFISVGILDVTVAVPAQASDTAPLHELPKLIVTIQLNESQNMEIRTEGAEVQNYPLPSRSGTWDFASMKTQLASLKLRFPKLDAAMVTAGDQIEYKEIVKTVEATREQLPNVALGTEQIGVVSP